ncbi:MAG: methionine adenosyltransferase [Bacilli bacterium]|nr:methionine adenosyltransferase [Bacilli bacterium]
MNMSNKLYTSESVTEGHPDKVCDQISDSILDYIIENDPNAHVACEVCATTGLVLVMGEITTNTYVDIPKIVRDTVKEIGYNNPEFGFNGDDLAVLVSIDEQSPDIAMGVLDDQGAGDQGLMFGYATSETEEYMPLPLVLSHKLAKRLAQVRKEKVVDYLRPDGKTQVTIEYNEKEEAVRIDSVVVSTQHGLNVSNEELRSFVKTEVIDKVLPKELVDSNTKIFINETGRFVLGGPKADSGLTGRKIIVDTYGGFAHHGGGAFSGKDPSKVDRSAAYMARYIAKNLVATGICTKAEIGLSYVIGVSEPTSIYLNTFGSASISEDEIVKIIKKSFPLTPKGIISYLGLRKPIYKQLAAYGHMGRIDLDISWEKLDKVQELKESFKKIL